MPKVSILLTCYNHLAYLPAAYDGILGQTFRDYEIIAIDDGSTDGTREWLSARTEPIKLIFNEKNLGTYGSLNLALAQASGDYVAILNDDDLWAPLKLERQLALFEAHPKVGLAHTDGKFINGAGEVVEGSPLGFEFPRTETGNVLLSLIYANKIIASAVLVKRQCFNELGGFNENYFGSGDWEMWMRVAEKHEIGFVPEPLTFYRVHGENASHKLDRIWRDDEMLREWISSRSSVYAGMGYGKAELDSAMAHNQACLGTVKTLNGDAGAGRAAYAQSIKLAPGRFKSYLRYGATFLPRKLFRKLL